MYQGENFLSGLNPLLLPFFPEPKRYRGGFIASGSAVCVNDVRQNIITFQTDGRGVRIVGGNFQTFFVGNPAGELFIEADGTILEEYHRNHVTDVRAPLYFVLDFLVPPYSRVTVDFINRGDLGLNRTYALTLTGWLEEWPNPERNLH